MTDVRLKALIVAVSLAASIAAGATEAPMGGSATPAGPAQKTLTIHFAYRETPLKLTYSKGMTFASKDDTGYYDFGRHLVFLAPKVLGQFGVRVAESHYIDGKEPRPNRQPMGGPLPSHLLVMQPTHAETTSDWRGVTRIDFKLEAMLIEVVSKRVVWKSQFDTRTFVDREVATQDAGKTNYDEDYAAQLLRTMATRMKGEGVI